mmetsp:Transcript_309/g.946  ORF Transcript_309/g.946 Transcript_309/m.946 type:complete len:208 (+) Transcript_309:337-960(+)
MSFVKEEKEDDEAAVDAVDMPVPLLVLLHPASPMVVHEAQSPSPAYSKPCPTQNDFPTLFDDPKHFLAVSLTLQKPQAGSLAQLAQSSCSAQPLGTGQPFTAFAVPGMRPQNAAWLLLLFRHKPPELEVEEDEDVSTWLESEDASSTRKHQKQSALAAPHLSQSVTCSHRKPALKPSTQQKTTEKRKVVVKRIEKRDRSRTVVASVG